ncbi:phage baseplate assembly protein V [Craterilacuibacter sinensis]|uniref:Phage baseplate assembly protein V n=1 Tax=Craterilacuibacter sinensis TaxID=2686017 RepID=A0A845BN36_9NEIS|nr:phage baseplate assembly protein V [Craterilacuibacter sinensis]MXR38017.1 phage baseplate assembly protein V [Craterilacuibacter sinensis]
MDEIADLIRRLESLIRYGTIAEVQMAPPRVRVQSGKLITAWRPWVSLRAGDTSEWDPPTVGEQCVFFSPSGDPSTGFSLVGLFSDAHPAPSSSPDEHVRAYPDGARIIYNHATGALSATGIKTGLIGAAEKCTVDCPLTEFTGDVHILGKLTVDGETLLKALLTYMAGMAGQGGDAGAKTVIKGDVEFDGDFHHKSGSFTSDEILQDGHTHRDSIGGMTGGPQ